MSWIILGVILFIVGIATSFFFFSDEDEKSYRMFTIVVSSIVLIFFLVTSPLTVVPAGHNGVLVFFGNVYGQISEGISMVNPLSDIVKMSVRSQEMSEQSDSPSNEGLNVHLDVSLIYRLDPSKVAEIYKTIGPNFVDVFIKPQFRAAIRSATVRHSAKDLYTSGRDLVTNDVHRILDESLKQRGIIVENILMRRIQLPEQVSTAINAKLQADQDAQRMHFVLEKERQEAERKRIEAKGIADFQNIVTAGISEPLLRWKGIEATELLAKSPNAKIVIIGGRDGMPLILNTK